MNNPKCRIIVASPFAILPPRRTKPFDFIVFLRKKTEKSRGFAKFADTRENILLSPGIHVSARGIFARRNTPLAKMGKEKGLS